MSHFVWLIINEYVALIWANEPDRSMYVMFKAPCACACSPGGIQITLTQHE